MNSGSLSSEQCPAHKDMRRTEAIILWVAGVGPMGLLWIVAAHFTEDPQPMSLGLLLGSVVLALGLWYARDWARWMVAVADTTFVALCVWGIWRAIASGPALAAVTFVGFGAIVAAGPFYALHPAVKRRFAAARESVARTRMTGTLP